ncbi:PepSY domain-containing protein [uncultured Cohaesibacter sp.]|uniref:PepSY domain-containing protein n=1 Tax=uncultured Cohaesibacter sp. TaxID=1002546 RepID=UPI0029C8BD0B|nr:PepSY domain-containing protein [uncultured Cohaesibacter sp.]
MKKHLNIHALRILALVTLAYMLPSHTALSAQCLGSGEMREAISAGRAQSLVAITQAATAVVAGDVIKSNLCLDGGRLVYDLVVLSRQGKVSRVTLDAKSGKVLSVKG